MTDEPSPTRESALLAEAAGRKRMKAPALAAALDDVKVDTMRNWLKGYRTVRAGEIAPARPDRFQLARLAQVLGIEAVDLRNVGRNDAARELDKLTASELPASTGASVERIVREELDPGLADYTDRQLLGEIEARLLVMAARLHDAGEDTLVLEEPDEGSPDRGIIGSRPPRDNVVDVNFSGTGVNDDEPTVRERAAHPEDPAITSDEPDG